MSRLKLVLAAGILLLGAGISFIGVRNVQAEELSEKQAGLVIKIQESTRHKAAIEVKLQEVRGQEAIDQAELDTKQTLELTIMKTLDYIDLELAKNRLILQQVTLQMLSSKEASSLPALGDGSFTWPVEGYYQIDQGYKSSHKAVDIATRGTNPQVFSVQTGIVIYAGNDGDGYGNKVIVDHGNGQLALYAHLNSISVELGALIMEGDQIGIVGDTGNSDGDHLHFMLTETGSLDKAPVDPTPYLQR